MSAEVSLSGQFTEGRDVRDTRGPWFRQDSDIMMFEDLNETYETNDRSLALELGYTLARLTDNRLPTGLQAGFLLPSLTAKEHLLHFDLSYSQRAWDLLHFIPFPQNYFPGSSMTDSRRVREWHLTVSGNYCWGLTNELTVLLNAACEPPHQSGSSWRLTNELIKVFPGIVGELYLPYSDYMKGFDNLRSYLMQQSWRDWALHVGVTCALRLLPGLELAATGEYENSREPMEGSLLFRYFSYSNLEEGASTLDTRNVAFSLRIALLPY